MTYPEHLPVARPSSLEEPWAPEWRQKRPVYITKSAPCMQACPANDRIREALSLIQDGELEKATLLWLKEQPLPSVMGRVCYAPCEEACNRAEYDQPVAIRNLERFLGDYAAERGLALTEPNEYATKAKVAILGSGPAGLACACHLARRGYQPTIFDALPVPGGMLRVGIPDYHLPKPVLEREIERILAQGVKLELNTAIEDLDSLFHEGYEAVFLATGAHRGLKLEVDGAELPAACTGADFLRRASMGQPVKVGRDVLVVGGGNVAIDAARTALRLGADRVSLVCLEDRETMPAHSWEIEAAEAEGIAIYAERAVQGVACRDDEITGVECLDVTYLSFDEHGNPTVHTRDGPEHVLQCDSVVFAIGQAPDLKTLRSSHGLLVNSRGLVSVDPATLMTRMQGVFAGGDVIPGCGTAAEALGLGKRAASSIDAYLNRAEFGAGEMAPIASYEELNLFYHKLSERNELPEVPSLERVRDFREVNPGTYDETSARAEAGRCLHCGDCSECDNCWIFCPDMAVLKVGGADGYCFEYAFCKGCGICAQECPCGVIHMTPENQAS